VATLIFCREVGQTWSFRGTKSRNKVTVGEPAVGSLLIIGFELIPKGVLIPNSPFVHCNRFLGPVGTTLWSIYRLIRTTENRGSARPILINKPFKFILNHMKI
jgi:hypothetical protein